MEKVGKDRSLPDLHLAVSALSKTQWVVYLETLLSHIVKKYEAAELMCSYLNINHCTQMLVQWFS